MKAIFAGTPEFARVALERLCASGVQVTLVLTQPDRPAGRGLKLQASPVKAFALEKNIPVSQPRSLRLDGKYPQEAETAREALRAAGADVMVVAAYGLILPQWVLDLPRLGCLNIHASLLPRWRGAAPIHRAIEAGDARTGVTIMQMDAGLDTGDMLLSEAVTIAETDTTGSLHDRLADLGARLVVDALAQATHSSLVRTPQPGEGVTYANKIDKHEAAIDWRQPATVIARRVRAFNPFPGAATWLDGESLKVWSARAQVHGQPGVQPTDLSFAPSGGAVPGTVLAVSASAVSVATADGVLDLLELQRAGGRRLGMADFLRGFDLKAGMVFGPPPSA